VAAAHARPRNQAQARGAFPRRVARIVKHDRAEYLRIAPTSPSLTVSSRSRP
jgi:hypothetical protein